MLSWLQVLLALAVEELGRDLGAEVESEWVASLLVEVGKDKLMD